VAIPDFVWLPCKSGIATPLIEAARNDVLGGIEMLIKL